MPGITSCVGQLRRATDSIIILVVEGGLEKTAGLRAQVCILAVGAAVDRVVTAPGGGFEAAQYINATLSCDHRVRVGPHGPDTRHSPERASISSVSVSWSLAADTCV